MHIALLGDSILDNKVYTRGEPDVAAHLRGVLSSSDLVTLCAIDGSATMDLKPQLGRVPSGASHLVLSLGGNDALMNLDMLSLPVTSTTEALLVFRDRILAFETSYRAALGATLSLRRETAICTIYNGDIDPPQGEVTRVALMMFNDVILRCGFERGLSIIDLRLICNEKSDYANPIEPSGSGGLKIAKAISGWLGRGRQKNPATVLTG